MSGLLSNTENNGGLPPRQRPREMNAQGTAYKGSQADKYLSEKPKAMPAMPTESGANNGFFDNLRTDLGLIGPMLKESIANSQMKADAQAQRPFQFDPRTGKKVYTDRANTLLEDRQAALDEMNDQVNKGWVKL